MLTLLVWIVFGLLVGLCAKAIHPGPVGFLQTIGIGVAGSFVGGGIKWVLGEGSHPYAPSGFVFSIIGGVICCAVWRWYTLKTSPEGPKSFFTGKTLR